MFRSLINRLCRGTYGESTIESGGTWIHAAVDIPEWKTGGVTIDWSTITAVSGADVTLPDGIVVKIGDKYIRYGTVIDRITSAAEIQTIDLSPGTDPTGGTFVINYTSPVSGLTYSTTPLAYNATAAVVQAALEALDPIQVGQVTVTGPTAFVYTFTFSGTLGDVPAMTVTNSLTGADTVPAVATGTPGNTKGGYYGPVDTSVSDGRQTMARGESFIVNETVVMSAAGSDHKPAVFDGGRVFQGRLLVGGTNQPTLANLLTAMPRLQLVNE